KTEAVAKFRAWARAKGEAWEVALEEALGTRPPMQSPNPSGKTQPKEQPKPLVKPLPKPSPKQEKEKEQQKEQEARPAVPDGGLLARVRLFQRATGQRPSPRKDDLFERFSFQKWWPSKQILDWAREIGVSDQDYDMAMVEARDKLGGLHDVEWWDSRLLSFIEQKSKKRSTDAGSGHGVILSP